MEKGQRKEKLILVVSFGSSNHRTRDRAIGGIERAIGQAFPEVLVRRAFTSGFIIRKLAKQDGIEIDDVAGALKKAAADGVTDLIIQPPHLMKGNEYQKLVGEAEAARELFSNIGIGDPLLSDESDIEDVITAITEHTKSYDDGKTAVLFMGHGSDADANTVYARMQERLVQRGFMHTYIATVEAEPTFEDVLAVIKEHGESRVVLQPLMVVAGDHALNDMAGDDESSWLSILKAEGYEVCPVLEGLGEMESIQEIYVEHVRECLA